MLITFNFLKPCYQKDSKSLLLLRNDIFDQNECFKWAVIGAMHYRDVYDGHKQRHLFYSTYRFWLDELNWNKITFPFNIKKSMHRFESQNPSINVNVILYDETQKMDGFTILYRSHNTSDVCINILAVVNQEHQSHYYAVKNLNGLLRLSTARNCNIEFGVPSCLSLFWSRQRLALHRMYGFVYYTETTSCK